MPSLTLLQITDNLIFGLSRRFSFTVSASRMNNKPFDIHPRATFGLSNAEQHETVLNLYIFDASHLD